VTQLQTALRLEPKHAPGHYNLGTALVVLGRREEAIAAYERAIALRDDYSDARSDLGGLLLAANRQTEAAEQFRLTLESDPDNTYALYNLGLMFQMQGDADRAVEQYRRALAIAPNDAETHNNLGQILAGQGQWEEAATEYLAAIETAPNLVSAVVKLAWLRATAPEAGVRDADRAVALAQRAADLTDRRNFIVMDTLGAAYAAAGRFDDAIAAANTAIALARAEGGEAETIESIRDRVTMYLIYRPFRTPR
jgi:tetratricopeptide (TPR) repeat protein